MAKRKTSFSEKEYQTLRELVEGPEAEITLDLNEFEAELSSVAQSALVSELKNSCNIIPDTPGVYFVLRQADGKMPDFLVKGTGGLHNGEDLNYDVDRLRDKWVSDTQIMYIGKTDSSLRKRIRTYMKYGSGNDAAHRGGRAIWQLPESDSLIVAWRELPQEQTARNVEKKLIKKFRNEHSGKLPFANWIE